MFFEVTTTRRNGKDTCHLIAVEDIGYASSTPGGEQAILTMKSSEHPIWTNETYAEVKEMIRRAGGTIIK